MKRVHLIGHSIMNHSAVADLMGDLNVVKWKPQENVSDVDILPEIGGRLCYMSYDKPRPGGNSAYLDHIKETKNESVLEHSSFNFVFIGISRTLTHELVRHRVGTAFSQLSQRYVDESGSVCIKPELLEKHYRENVTLNDKLKNDLHVLDFLNVMETYWELERDENNENIFDLSNVFSMMERLSKSAYKLINHHLMSKGIYDIKQCRQNARSVLLGSNETKIMFSVNARELRHIFGLRGSSFADSEIRGVAIEMFDLVSHFEVFSDWEKTTNQDGIVELTKVK